MNKREELRLLTDKCIELLKEKYHVKKIFLIVSYRNYFDPFSKNIV
ncbi:MAG: hypothetical protein L3J18_12175 [Candidatus Brocadia sp.]|uniref:Uncharacterized protein n=1 Tax=Candidatus Brocadia fulgida TaxID=380242 RepID=A0A0M2V241_9BACT|nr:MAG: hypothetical protein BROFUL_00073 [Candidatus Brocadia fulgida]MBV6519682.1 hypothetical protein [Candidatus Brocadia fulgida]MCC6326453.1 hypothetical protein [Candidatus Brocadia sp.]UJS19656.1 MAG: hypothetical protein L3J18_12175 [Candidatus Brocadia sp.]